MCRHVRLAEKRIVAVQRCGECALEVLRLWRLQQVLLPGTGKSSAASSESEDRNSVYKDGFDQCEQHVHNLGAEL